MFATVFSHYSNCSNYKNHSLSARLADPIDGLGDKIGDTLDGIDFGSLRDQSTFSGDSFITKIGKILSGDYASDFPSLTSAVLNLLGGAIKEVLPLIVLIVGIAILSGFIQSMKSDHAGGGVHDVVHFAAYAAVVTIVLYAVADLTLSVGKTLGAMKTQMDILFPILLTLMATIGGTASVSVYSPAVALLSNGLMQIFSYVVMPLFIITMVFSVIGNLGGARRYDKFVSFFSSCFKWVLGVTFTVFLGFLTIQGITAGAHDGVSIRAAKFTMSSYVPFLGGYLSQGFDLILASAILVKNAIGLAGLYLLLGVILAPVFKIAVFMLGLKLAAAVTEPLTDPRISNFLTSINKAFSMLLAIVIGAGFAYLITIGLVILTGNVI